MPVTLIEGRIDIIGASWGADDQIIFGSQAGLFRVSGGGGEPEALTTPDTEALEESHWEPGRRPREPHSDVVRLDHRRSVDGLVSPGVRAASRRDASAHCEPAPGHPAPRDGHGGLASRSRTLEETSRNVYFPGARANQSLRVLAGVEGARTCAARELRVPGRVGSDRWIRISRRHQ